MRTALILWFLLSISAGNVLAQKPHGNRLRATSLFRYGRMLRWELCRRSRRRPPKTM